MSHFLKMQKKRNNAFAHYFVYSLSVNKMFHRHFLELGVQNVLIHVLFPVL